MVIPNLENEAVIPNLEIQGVIPNLERPESKVKLLTEYTLGGFTTLLQFLAGMKSTAL